MRSEAKKKTILTAASTLLVETGGPQLTMRKVAERAGISLGNLQYHFANREALLIALMNDFLKDYEENYGRLSAHASGNLKTDLEQLFLLIFSDPHMEFCGIIFKELWAESQHHQAMKEAMTAYYSRLKSFYANFLSALSNTPSDSPEIKRAVSLLLPLMEGYCITGNISDLPQKELALSWSEIIVSIINTKYEPQNYSVYRLDDNNNMFEIATNLSQKEAEKIAQDYEAKGHKQAYFTKKNS